jgi:serine/threonine protein kinase
MQAEYILQKRYQLNQKLGQNAGRQTWLATDTQSSPPSPVIVKLLAFNPQMQWDDLKLFEREALVLKNINHPRIPQYRDYFSVDDVEGSGLRWFGLVQDYIPGDSLQQILNTGRRFIAEKVRSIATQVLQILMSLHELSPPVFHRDIKPSNLILGKDNQIYLVDFGAVQDRAKAEGATFTVVGTSGYAPPEQLWGKAVPASDLYALGATLIHLLTGISPFELPQHQMRIQFKERVSVNPEFANWIEQLIQPAPERRFSSARQALEALQFTYSWSFNSDKIYQKDSPKYAAVFLLTCLIISGLSWSILSIFNHQREEEAKLTLGKLFYAQEDYFSNKQALTTSSKDLGLDTQNKNYEYTIVASPGSGKTVTHKARARRSRLKSYVLIMGPINDHTKFYKSYSSYLSCQSDQPTTKMPPTAPDGTTSCQQIGMRDWSGWDAPGPGWS